MNKPYLYILLLAVTIFNACSENKEEVTFNEKDLIRDIVEGIAQPNVRNFTQETKKLQDFFTSYNDAKTIENLNILKTQWKAVALQYSLVYAFNIGDVKNSFFKLKLNNWPATINAIENFITDKEITPENIMNFGSSAKGIPGIEYLIFSENESTINDKLANNTKRVAYLGAIIAELHNNAVAQEALWDTYGDYLINNEQESIKGSFNLLFNGLNNVIHFAAETKLGKPAGFIKTGGVNSEILQAYYSAMSLELIKANVKSVREVFFKSNSVNIANKIDFITKDTILSDRLNTQFDLILNAIASINDPLVTSLETEKDKVRVVFDELVKLEILFTADVRSALSLIITGTDGDGD